jgi:hypothetical protein
MQKKNKPLFWMIAGMVFALALFFASYSLAHHYRANEVPQAAIVLPMNLTETTPEWLNYELAPGEQFEDELLLYNPNKTTPLSVTLGAVDSALTSTGDFTLREIEAPENIYFSEWITIDETQVTLEPGEWKIIPFTLTLPESIELGDYSGGIVSLIDMSQNEAIASEQSSGFAINYQVGLRVYLRVSDDPHMPETQRRVLDFKSNPYLLTMAIISSFAAIIVFFLHMSNRTKN